MAKSKARGASSTYLPNKNKFPRSQTDHDETTTPLFSFQYLDKGGEWCIYEKAEAPDILGLMRDLGNYEQMKWNELLRGGSHRISVESLTRKAQDRLYDIKQADIEELFSISITNKKRLWGIRDRHILRLLWWDPNHEVCESNKKHT
ncbi:MAG: hypothetical protein ACYC1M_13765 [Armatimonadota bacterium]